MVVPIYGDMHFIPPVRQKRTGADGDKVRFEEYLVETVDAVDREPASRDGKEGAGKGREGIQSQTDEREENGSHGSGPSGDDTLQGRRIDLRA